VRHNKVRNEVLKFCHHDAAISNAELEKAGLLLPARPSDEQQSARRPADIYLPRWYDGLPAALDFAVTSPNQSATVGIAAREALHAAVSYSETKRAYLNTVTQCQAQGVTFLPMVCETSGAWAPEASAVLKQLARQAASRDARPASEHYRALLQRLAVKVRTANAKAHLRRM
jgi:cytochrome c5